MYFMKLHKWPYWLRGGLCAVALVVLAPLLYEVAMERNFLAFPFVLNFLPKMGGDFVTPLFCPLKNFGMIVRDFHCTAYVSGILSFVQSFLFGALLGWLYGKIKNRKDIL